MWTGKGVFLFTEPVPYSVERNAKVGVEGRQDDIFRKFPRECIGCWPGWRHKDQLGNGN